MKKSSCVASEQTNTTQLQKVKLSFDQQEGAFLFMMKLSN